ncbi:MAG: DUF3536 domain-containing protein [Candidatus Margulisbacteria bacterium]|nr:DUF3536 domain-containing protein [Candidatus Margulisiibacteriota bacterium]
MPKYITIHGHFYQPPRENPYLGKIEMQESAYPNHDWNERINEQCYRPNTCSRVLNERGKILDVINNYEYLSFNIGPTLMNWLAENDKDTYSKIVEADEKSKEKNHGHGNAIAQVYNHLIMPLAPYRDKVTQVRWGIEDFKKHFGREPEGLWLAETAINMETAKVLVENNIKFTILSPFQAEKTRNFFSNTWLDVSGGTIDPTQPYRLFVDEEKTKYLDIFFYDAPISTAVSFEHILRDSRVFADRLNLAALSKEERPTLINIATDGESYGHHEPFGDMCLAYFFKYLVHEYRFRIINYGHFLELYPPISEVVLKTGKDNLGTAWSCSHGVGRWKEDCGCSTYAAPGWNQKWRSPLLKGLETLRDRLWEIYLRHTQSIFHDPLEARHDYYRLFKGLVTRDEYFKKHLKKKNIDEQKMVGILNLLESQRNSQLMFTSCGWFFADISGIETVQIIKYANMAIKHAQTYSDHELENELLNCLKLAYSNVGPDYNGDSIYNKWIKPYELDAYKATNQYMIEGELFHQFKPRQVYLFDIKTEQVARFEQDGVYYILANLDATHTLTGDHKQFSVILQNHEKNYRLFISEKIYQDLAEIMGLFHKKSAKKEELISRYFPILKTMNDLNFEASSSIMSFLWEKKYNQLIHSLDLIFVTFRDLIMSTVYMGGFLPHEIKSIMEIIMSARYLEEIKKIDVYKQENVVGVTDVINMSKKMNLNLNKNRAKAYLEETLNHQLKALAESLKKEDIEKAIQFIAILDYMDITLNKTVSENIAFKLYQDLKNNSYPKITKVGKEVATLALMLNIAEHV